MLMKNIEVAAALIITDGKVLATQRGYGNYTDWWEFPGGKRESGETPEDALVREIHEELEADIRIERLFDTIEYDYPEFHMTMYCYICSLVSEKVKLVEHEAAKWLGRDELFTVKWLPSDIEVVEKLKAELDQAE